jgi:hypothetical protein
MGTVSPGNGNRPWQLLQEMTQAFNMYIISAPTNTEVFTFMHEPPQKTVILGKKKKVKHL